MKVPKPQKPQRMPKPQKNRKYSALPEESSPDYTPTVRNVNKVRITMSMSEYMRKYLMISVVGIIIVLFQTSAIGLRPPFGATPDLIFMYIIAISFFDTPAAGSIAAIAGGALSDAAGAAGATPTMLFYFGCAVAISLLANDRLSKNFAAWGVCSTSACIFAAAYRFFYVSATSLDYSILDLFGKTIAPEFAVTVLSGIPVYFIVRKIYGSF